MAYQDEYVWLSGVGELRIFQAPPPPNVIGDRVDLLRFESALRDWIARGVGANHHVWVRIYEWLGRKFPAPPQREDFARLADELVAAFARGRLVAIATPAARATEIAPATLREAAPPYFEADVAAPVEVTEPTTWIRISLAYEDGTPVARRPYRIVTPSGAVLDGILDDLGMATHQGVTPGECDIWCPLVEARPRLTHVVSETDHTSAIAQLYGFEHLDEVWEHSANAPLRRLRNPDVLLENDVVILPEVQPEPAKRSTGASHAFVLRRSPLSLRVKVFDWQMRPAANGEGQLLGMVITTDREGKTEVPIAKARWLSGWIDAASVRAELVIGALNPVAEEAGGWMARLFNLGFLWDPEHLREDDEDAKEIKFAIEDFQAEYRLPITGVMDDPTRAKLVTVYGC